LPLIATTFEGTQSLSAAIRGHTAKRSIRKAARFMGFLFSKGTGMHLLL